VGCIQVAAFLFLVIGFRWSGNSSRATLNIFQFTEDIAWRLESKTDPGLSLQI